MFSDIRLPGDMDGIHLARWVNENRRCLPLILTSGDAARSEAAREICRAYKILFFTKPYDVFHVAADIQNLMEARRR